MPPVSPEQLYQFIGMQQIELATLRARIAEFDAKIAKLTPKDTPTKPEPPAPTPAA